MERTVPQEFVLVALFSGVGRLQKRAGLKTTDSVVETSRCWLKEKSLCEVAATSEKWEGIIRKAAYLALGLQTSSDTDRLEKDAGPLRPLLSLFSKVPLGGTEEKAPVGHFSPHSLEAEYAYPSHKQEVSQCDYKELWEKFEKEITALGTDLTTDAALVLLEKYTASVPCLLAGEETDPPKRLLFRYFPVRPSENDSGDRLVPLCLLPWRMYKETRSRPFRAILNKVAIV